MQINTKFFFDEESQSDLFEVWIDSRLLCAGIVGDPSSIEFNPLDGWDPEHQINQ